ncbi:hypothetical protein GDO86_009868 [Hymenochirus boettgeri]|uniref:PHD finger protein 3 n=1 Tax=Hymenochirus boettgeri TaxID=247094 RepID=A0A8T2JN34_9PIPI|nr:hypothetical protein GDO86_009868 [Hymenochirus boettgeri]
MDIVDTFNHLIPTDHLDDALFLGSSLETEGCEEFATGQHVIEDSLKNMLSDKDPMLGSASTQFCLPVLDTTNPDFQIPSSSGGVLDEIMDVGDVKVAVNDPSVGENLMLSKDRPKLNDSSLQSLRKSPRLKAQESVRNQRPHPTDKCVSPTKVINAKAKSSRKDARALENKVDVLPLEYEEESKNSQTGQSPSPRSRRSARVAHGEFKDKKDPKQTNDGLNCDHISMEENLNIFSKESTIQIQDDIDNQVLTHSKDLTHPRTKMLDKAVDENIDEGYICSAAKKNEVIYDTVHKELALLSGFVKCDLDVSHSTTEGESLVEISSEKVEEVNSSKCTGAPDWSVKECKRHLSEMNPESIESRDPKYKNCQEEKKGQITDKETSQEEESFQVKNLNRHRKVSSTKSNLPPASRSSTNATAAKNLKKQKGTPGLHKLDTNLEIPTSTSEEKNIVKKKAQDNTKNVKTYSKDRMSKKNTFSFEKNITIENPITKHLDDERDNQARLKDMPHSSPGCIRARNKSLSQSSEKSTFKHQMPTLPKVNSQGKDDGDQKESLDNLEEKSKLKKSLSPRQRRSSRSICVDEPPLFIPDNIPAVKREGLEITSPTDKSVGSPIQHCCSCLKLHGNRFMVGCGRCDDWFHGECVGLTLSQAQQMENEDREYICFKCCNEEETIAANNSGVSDNLLKTELQEITMESSKKITKSLSTSSSYMSREKAKPTDDSLKQKVKIIRKDSGDGKHIVEKKDVVAKKYVSSHQKHGATESYRTQEEKHEKSFKEPLYSQCNDEKSIKLGASEKQENKKRRPEKKGPSANVHISTPPTPKPSIDQIRQSVRQSLKDILFKRLSESSSKIPEDRAIKVSMKIEKELFSFYRDTDSKYKNKYRSLMFNLKDPKNKLLYKRVLKGEITPEHLIRMSPEELASRELAAWRQRENRHTIEMIEKEQREVERRPITKITHKGEIEIENETPMKEPEAMDTIVKLPEKEEEIQKDQKDLPVESPSDTTVHHKNHLFDLNCKICTGRMAPPAEDLSPIKASPSAGLLRKQSDNGADSNSELSSSSSNALNIDVLESSKQLLHEATSSEPFHITDTIEDESTFLARLTCIWKGYLNMPSVAKLVIKAYPVSGSLEHLTEDLPESIQVGGRISPQTVWDYVDKIKASGTKETCVVRFSPLTEEDQISYTLLYSYFSSRKRYGVVANNMRQVKDMYLIPLGASEKVPHFFVPFDGPGLELHRPNLLLGLIIRQKVKRLHSTSLDDEPSGALLGTPVEKMSKIEFVNDDEEEDDENDFFNSFTTVLHKNRNRPPLSDTDEPQAVTECVPEPVKREPPKPLRFLPGVLVGWENPQSTLDLASKPLPVDDILQSLLGTSESTYDENQAVTGLAKYNKHCADEKIHEKEEAKNLDDKVVGMETTNDYTEESTINSSIPALNVQGFSLKGKPPDVSTDTYLSNLNIEEIEESTDDLIDKPFDANNDTEKANSSFSPAIVSLDKSSNDDSNSNFSENITPSRSPKLLMTKRDPRQAAVRPHKISSPDIRDLDIGKNEENLILDDENKEMISVHNEDKSKKQSYIKDDLNLSKSDRTFQHSSTDLKETECLESSKSNESKPFLQNILIDDTDPLQQFKRALAANKSQSKASSKQPSNENILDTSKTPISTFGGHIAAAKFQQPQFLSIKSNTPVFPFQHNPSFPLQSNPMFSYAPHIPPLLPTPLGMGFPRPPRFQAADTALLNPLVAWHPAIQLPRQPPQYLGQLKPGLLLGSEQTRYQVPQKFGHKEHRSQERRHSEPWDKQDRISERSCRGSRGEYRQRYYSESHHSREKRQYEKESGSDKHVDKDSERSRHRERERDRDRSRERDRKSRDDSHREKDRSRSHSEKSCDGKTHKESRSADKSKNEDRSHDKDKSRDRNREEEKDRERSHRDRDRDHSDKVKSKR